MIPAWPATLPQHFERKGTAFAEGDGRLGFETGTGPGKMRRRSTAVANTLQGQMKMTLAQVLRLRTFVQADTIGGSLPFTLPDLFGGPDLLVRFKKDEGLPQYQNIAGPNWMVSFKLDVLP